MKKKNYNKTSDFSRIFFSILKTCHDREKTFFHRNFKIESVARPLTCIHNFIVELEFNFL